MRVLCDGEGAYLVKAVDWSRFLRKFKPLFHLYPDKLKLSTQATKKSQSRERQVEPEINLSRLFPYWN